MPTTEVTVLRRIPPSRLAALTAALVLAACADDPVRPATPRPATVPGPAQALSAVPGASMPVRVDVPASMRWGAFRDDRSLTVPPNFRAAVYARVDGARFMAVAPNGDLLVSRPNAGKIVLVRPDPAAGDPAVSDWATGLYRPHDIVFHATGGEMYVYVSEGDKIARYRYTSGDATGQERQVVVSDLPSASTPELRGRYGHELKNIAVGDDGRLYVSIASTCNACVSDTESDPVRGAIYVYNADGSDGRLFARGLRNAEGLAFVPGTNTLWVAVNNRDNIAYPFHDDITGDGADDYGRVIPAYVNDHPPEAFTRVRDGGNYGWPFCNPNPDTPVGLTNMPLDRDAELNPDGERLDCAAADRTTQGIQAHSAPLGLTFFQGTNAPDAYRTGAAIALHGSWNRQQKTGYKVVFFPWDAADDDEGAPGAETDLVTGWATANSQWGRPVDVAVDPAGSILVSDDYSGTIYKFTYTPPTTADEVALTSAATGTCLDVLGADRAPGTPLVIHPCHSGDNQRFTLPAQGATGEIRVYGTMCLDAAGGSGNNGDAIIVWPCHGGANQQWTLTAGGEIRGVNGRCIDVEGARTDNLTPVILSDCYGGSSQRWDAGS